MSQANQARWVAIEPTNPPQSIPIYSKSISGVLYESITDLGTAGGNITLVSSTVPAGERWVIQNVIMYDVTSALAWSEIRITKSGETIRLRRLLAPGAGVETIFNGEVILEEGYWIGAYFRTAVAGDNLYLFVVGYKLQM